LPDAIPNEVDDMELLLLAVLGVVALSVLLVHRRHKVVAWDRELEQAFGAHAGRDVVSHRRL
jgi:hypothetical protein